MSRREARTQDLIEAARLGDEQALNELVVLHLPYVRAFVRLKATPEVRARESCSDLVQSVFREVCTQIDRFEYRGEGSFRAWLCARAWNKLKNRVRFHARQKRNVGREVAVPSEVREGQLLGCYSRIDSPSQVAMKREGIDQLETSMDQLPEHYREVIVQARILEMSYAEIAAATGRSEGAVRVLLSRALLRLASIMDRGAGTGD